MNVIQTAQPHLLVSIQALLMQCDLPASDLTAKHLDHFLTMTNDMSIVACIGIEPYGDAALLRSLAVSPDLQKGGLGRQLLTGIEEYARQIGVLHLYLLTTTASDFFERCGYRRIDRASAPHSLQLTAQFSNLCPSSSTCMVKDISQN